MRAANYGDSALNVVVRSAIVLIDRFPIQRKASHRYLPPMSGGDGMSALSPEDLCKTLFC